MLGWSSLPTLSSSPQATPSRISTAQLGLRLLLASLGVLFVASSIAVLVTAENAHGFRPTGGRGLPASLWGSSALLLATSALMQSSLSALRRNRRLRSQRRLRAAALSAALFLVLQAHSAARLLESEQRAEAGVGMFVFCFYLLVGVHALHVLGGLVAVAVSNHQLSRGEYSASRSEGLALCVQYFHFLGLMWLLLLVTLLWVA